jgi:two-component system CheB/CheR fusion protein
LTSRRTPIDADEGAADPAGVRELIERAGAALGRNAASRVEASRTLAASQDALSAFLQIRLGAPEERRFRLAALNLMEDAVEARRAEETAAQQRAWAEAEVARTAERYGQLIGAMREGLAIVELPADEPTPGDASILEANRAFAALFGRATLHGARLSDLVDADGHREWMRHLERVRRTGDASTFELRVAASDTWINVSVARSPEPERRLAVVVSDIGSRKRAETALRSSEARLRLIVENAREYAIFSMAPDRRIETWNAGAQAILGWSEGEVLGQSGDLIFTDEDRAAAVPERESAAAIAHDRASDERWHVRKDGSRFWGSGVMTAMRDDTGQVIGLLKIFRDQTAELLAQRALEEGRLSLQQALEEAEQARADAEAAGAAKDHFLAVLSHELRTPLTPVLLAVEMLAERDDVPPDVLETVAMIRRNVALEAHFVDDLLDVTRITRGKVELAREPLDLHDTLAVALEIARGDVDAKRQRLAVDFAAVRCRVAGDRARLQQVFWNLLKNASKFTPAGGGIAVRTRDEGDAIVVEIVDEGIGIDASRLSAIFDPFVQADPTIAREFGGLGLGLAIARATVEAHGGTLVARSEGPGRGATFSVTLPRSP